MYIAFKWLFSLCLVMWFAICSVTFISSPATNIAPINKTEGAEARNITIESPVVVPKRPKKVSSHHNRQYCSSLHYIMFFAGALAVSILNRKQDIILYTKTVKLNTSILAKQLEVVGKIYFKKAAVIVCIAIKHFTFLWGKILKKVKIYVNEAKNNMERQRSSNLELINKLKNEMEEKQAMAIILLATLRQNKDIKLKYELENRAKARLTQYIENSQRIIRESQSKYMNYQHLYVDMYQENLFLKAKIKKLTEEKEQAETNLSYLIDQIYLCNNDTLKTFCSRFKVKINQNLFQKRDANNELNVTGNDIKTLNDDDFVETESSSLKVEIHNQSNMFPLISDRSNVRILSKGYDWTLNEENVVTKGIHEYNEYEYQPEFDNGDTIRQIRQCYIYCDKDSYDNTSSENIFPGSNVSAEILDRQVRSIHRPLRINRFLTESEAFQNFMRENREYLTSTNTLPFLTND